MQRSALRILVVTVSLISGAVIAPPAAANGPPSRSERAPAPWQTGVARSCTKASHELDTVLADFPEALATGERVTFRELSTSDRNKAAAFFLSLSRAKVRFAKHLDAITPDRSSAKTYTKLVAAVAAEALAYENAAREIRALKSGKSDKGAIGDELGVASQAEGLASQAVDKLGIACEAVQVSDEPPPPAAGTTTCVSGDDPSNFVEVACTEAHNGELFTTIEGVYPENAPYPDIDEALAIAQQRCQPAFETFVGIPFDKSEYDVGYIIPAEPQWAQGNRSVDCYVLGYPPGTKLTGSAAGTKR